MTGLTTVCEECNKQFDPRENKASAGSITVASAAAGAVGGAQVGIAMGPYGAIAGTVPGSIAGLMGGHIVDSKWVTCPHCGTTQRI